MSTIGQCKAKGLMNGQRVSYSPHDLDNLLL